MRQIPGSLQNLPCHLSEEAGVQLMRAASFVIWCRYLDTHKNKHNIHLQPLRPKWKKYAQHRIQKDQTLGQREDKCHIHNQQCENK